MPQQSEPVHSQPKKRGYCYWPKPNLHHNHQRNKAGGTEEEEMNASSLSPDAVSGVFGDLIAPVFSPSLPSLVQKVHQI